MPWASGVLTNLPEGCTITLSYKKGMNKHGHPLSAAPAMLPRRAFLNFTHFYYEQETNTMSKIYTSAEQLIGHTPLLELTHIEAAEGLEARLLAKLEYFNPDRKSTRLNSSHIIPSRMPSSA